MPQKKDTTNKTNDTEQTPPAAKRIKIEKTGKVAAEKPKPADLTVGIPPVDTPPAAAKSTTARSKKAAAEKVEPPPPPPPDIHPADSPPAALKEDAVKKGAVSETYLNKKARKRIVNLDIEKAERYNPAPEKGLTQDQIELRYQQGYFNAVEKKTGKTYGAIILGNIFSFFNILTFIVAIALLVTTLLAGEAINIVQYFFLIIILANICIGLIQGIKAKRTIDKLSLVTAPSATVIRDGEKRVISIDEIVLDDIVLMEMGKQISADSVMLTGACEVNESVLTGESEPVKKQAGDILYSGSYISSGSCYARVDKCGEKNYIETLASHAKRYRQPRSELQGTIKLIMKVITFFIVFVSVMMFIQGLTSKKADPLEELELTQKIFNIVQRWSGAVIGMLPTGMFLLSSLALAMGVIRLAKRNTSVKDLYCIEMLAHTDVLCIDKTGTLTDGFMNVNKVIPLFKEEDADARIAAIIGSILTATEDNNQTAIALAGHFGYSAQLRPIKVLPFSSQRKYSAVSFEDEDTFVLGAPEFVLKEVGVRLDALVGEYASQGYRVLVLAQAAGTISDEGRLPSSRKAIALIVIEDHIRDDAVETIKWFKDNDVQIKIISGDNPVTVSEVARRVGVDKAEFYISLDGLSNQEVIEAADKFTVFGRVTPEQKSTLVKSLKAKGHTVAMTGDGVNDILAMREADCAIAIASGAEAARNVSHIVLMDSNFTAMPDVVAEGRRVINNITKSSSLFLTKTFMSLLLSIIFLLIPDETYPFTTNNLLLLELFVIGVPSTLLALQPNNQRIKGNFLTNVIGRAIPGGLALVISIMAIYFYSDKSAPGYAVEITPTLLTSLYVSALTFTGFVVLIKICEPFNVFRVFVVFLSFMLIMIAILVPGIGSNFGIIKMNIASDPAAFTHLLFLFTAILLSYFIITIIMRILRVLKIME